ncbi:MAG TPA: flavin monoamine oxidase family protein [Solirubrobacteraceae bacterium]
MSDALSRRRFLGGAAAAVAAGVLPGDAEARRRKHKHKPKKHRRKTRKVDVAVVGAGLAGLNAARTVAAAGKSVLVLEARNRVGGRTLNHDIGGGEVIEIGGQWVGPTQDRIVGLGKELGVDTFKVYNEGDNVYFQDGRLTPYASSGPLGPIPPDPTGAPEAFKAIQQLNAMALEIPLDAPWKAAKAAEYDGQTFETWKLANTTTPEGRALLDLGIEAVWACEPRDVSLLHVLFYIHAAGNEQNAGTFDRLIGVAGGAQESRFVGGSQLVSLRMAEQLGAKRIQLRAPVRRIDQRGRLATLTCDRGITVKAKQVIVAAPPAITALIDHDPLLPADRAQLTQRFPMGSVIKCEAIYDKPFWRGRGLTGQATSDTGPVKITFDNTPPDGGPGVLLGFIEGHDARVWTRRSPEERRNAVLKNLADYFGPEAAKPVDYVEMNWETERWTRGCYVGYTPPGVLLDYGEAIRAPVGRVHWAGAETATIWNGYMDGAVRSGERAATEALGEL